MTDRLPEVSVSSSTAPLALLRDSFRSAKLARREYAAAASKAGAPLDPTAEAVAPPLLLLRNVHYWKGHAEYFTPDTFDVLISRDQIVDIMFWDANLDGGIFGPPDAVIDCQGGWLVPGLCDAHVHCTAVTADLAGLRSLPGGCCWPLRALDPGFRRLHGRAFAWEQLHAFAAACFCRCMRSASHHLHHLHPHIPHHHHAHPLPPRVPGHGGRGRGAGRHAAARVHDGARRRRRRLGAGARGGGGRGAGAAGAVHR